jgi:hypothetical protein
LREDGTNKILGPTESIPADDDDRYEDDIYETNSLSDPGTEEPSWVSQLAVELVTELISTLPWDEICEKIVAPAIERKMVTIRKRVRSTIGRLRGRALTLDAHADSSEEVDILVEAPSAHLSSAEYRERALAALLAHEYAAWQREILSKAYIEDGDLPPELTSAIQLMLEGTIASLDEDTLAAVMKFLTESQSTEHNYVLPRRGAKIASDG